METLLQDVRFALRSMWRRPGFSALVALVLAVGIGATGAMFGVLRGTLLAPLPFVQPDQLVVLYAPQPEVPKASLSGPDFKDWKEQTSSFESLAAVLPYAFNMAPGGEPVSLQGARVSGEYFRVMGVQAQLGRVLGPEDDRPDAQVVVVSDRLWRERLGGDADVIGRSYAIDGKPYQVIGVLPEGERFVAPAGQGDVWLPLGLDPVTGDGPWKGRGSHYLNAIGRMRPGVSAAAAQTDLEAIAARLAEQYPDNNTNVTALVVPLKEQLVGSVSAGLWLLFGAIAFVLILVCANVANLLLARGAARQGELAMRAALGASRARLVRQLLTESVVLALVGGALGALFSLWAIDLFAAALSSVLPVTAHISLDGPSIGFTFGVAALAGVVAGVAPALTASRRDAFGALKEGAARATLGSRGGRMRSALVMTEVAIAITLLVGAGLLLQSFAAVRSVDSGFDPANVQTAQLMLPKAHYQDPASVARFERAVEEQLRTQPGVLSVGAIDRLPQGGSNTNGGIELEGQPPFPPGEEPVVERRRISPTYFETMGIRVLNGRGFDDGDRAGGVPVMIVNQAFADRFFPGEEALGKRVRWNTDELPFAEIVGIVADVRTNGQLEKAPLESYLPFDQLSDWGFSLVMKTQPGVDGGQLFRAAVATVDPMQPLHAVRSMDEVVERRLSGRRFTLVLLAAFAACALLLAAMGIFGVISHQTSQRTREMGIRLALGARPRDVVWLVVRQSMAIVGAGIALGVLCALAGSRLIESFLFGTSSLDPVVYGGVSGVVALVGLAASYLPARRAASIAPWAALRYE